MDADIDGILVLICFNRNVARYLVAGQQVSLVGWYCLRTPRWFDSSIQPVHLFVMACFQAQPDLAERYPVMTSIVTQNLVRFLTIGGLMTSSQSTPEVTSSLVMHNFGSD